MTGQTPLEGTDWDLLLRDEFGKDYWTCLQTCIEQERSCYKVYPDRGEELAALLLTPLAETRVVIVGLDPYQSHDIAHGLAFSVRRRVKKKQFPPSLRNIVRALQQDPDLPADVRASDPSGGSLESWADRGVLLLNLTLTVREGVTSSHRGMGWETFTTRVIHEAEKRRPVFMLWGKQAHKTRQLLLSTPDEMIIKSPHPRMATFPASQPFSRASTALKEAGREPMDWSLMD